MGPSFRLARRGLPMLSLGVAVSLATLHGQAPSTPMPTGTGLIAGRVIDADSGQGIAAAMVALAGQFTAPEGQQPLVGRPAPPVIADSQGRFVFSGLAAGTFLAVAQLDGYADLAGRPPPFELKDGDRFTNIILRLHKLSSISGAVRERGRDPVVDTEVIAFRRTATQGRPPAWVATARTKTNDRGEYRLAGLAADDYYLCACSRDPIPFDGRLLSTLAARPLDLINVALRASRVGANAASLDDTLPTIAPTFYPNVALASRATPIRIAYGDDRTNADIAVSAVRAVRVSGRITGATETAVSAATLALIPVGDLPEAQGLTQLVPMLVQPDGRFDFAGVPPGEYTLEFHYRQGARGTGGLSGAALAFVGARAGLLRAPEAASTADEGALWASVPISVGNEDITDLVVGAQPGLLVRGHVEFVGTAAQPFPDASRSATVSLMPLEQRFSRSRMVRSVTQADGTFVLEGLIPGRYAVTVDSRAREWQTLRSVALGGVDILDTIVAVSASTSGELVVTLTDVTMTTVAGRVTGDTEEPSSGTLVHLFPGDQRYWQEPFGAARRFRSAPVTPTGEFVIERVPAGEYYLVATPVSNDGQVWMAHDALETLSRRAQLIRVANGEKKMVEVKR